jgi:serine/threonine protein kinase
VTLKHPNVVQVYDFERLELSDGTSFYIVMELIDGVHLGKWTRQISDDQFAFQRRLKMAEQITTAFDAAHNCSYFDKAGFQLRGVLHGDIKPTNIHVRKNNEPAIMDFMLVDVQRLLHGGESTARPAIGQTDMLTAVFGTPGYMAPEQENTGIVTVQSDVYALGMTFFDLFFPVGEPVSASTVSSQQAMHICKTLTSAETRSLYPGLCELLTQMTDADPKRRPQEMKSVRESLLRIAECMRISLNETQQPAVQEVPKLRSWLHRLFRS